MTRPCHRSAFLLLMIITMMSCRSSTPAASASLPQRIAPPAAWSQYATPGEAGFDGAALELIRNAADEAGSAAVIAVADGRVVAAWGDVERKLELHSVRKSLYAALWGIAIERGLVRLDATLSDLGIDDLQPLTEAENGATVGDLLRARSGVYHPAAYAAADDESGRPPRGSHPPGTFWYYNNWDFNVAGALLERVGGKPLGLLFDEWIADPIGMEDYSPDDVFAVLEPRVSRWPALTFRMSTRDLARFGQLWLDRGRWSSQQVVPADWIELASAPASPTGETGQGYAMMWWTYEKGSLSAARYPAANRFAILQARGTGGQSVFVVPDAGMVVVHRGDTDHGRAVGGRAVWTLVDRLLAARTGDASPAPRTTEIRPEPLRNTLPPLEWPQPLPLAPDALVKLAGIYEFAPGMRAEVFIHEGRLFAFMPREGEGELFARSSSEFYLRVDPTVGVRFELEPDGTARAVRITMKGREMTGKRVAGNTGH